MTNKYSTAPIPTRLRLSQAVAGAVAKLLMDKLVSGWGLVNSIKIVTVLMKMLKTEKKRRKELEKT